MKNLFLAFFLTFFIIGCQTETTDFDDQNFNSEGITDTRVKPAKTTICHYDTDLDESYQITISENGLNGHNGTNGPRHEFDNFVPLATDVDGDGIGDCADCDDEDASPEASLKKMWYQDADGDGYGNSNVFIETCLVRDGYVADNTDCDDSDAALNQDDVDGDGYTTCEGDCDDENAAINPSATEVCDGIDNNCDGNIDEGVIYSPVGTFVAEYSGGFQWDIEITSFDGLTGDFEGVGHYPAGGPYQYTDKVIEDGNVNLDTGVFTGWFNHPPTPAFNGTVSPCGGVSAMSGNWTLVP